MRFADDSNDVAGIHRQPVARPDPAEIEQAGSDRFAAESFALDEPEVLVEVFSRLGPSNDAFVDRVLERLGTGGDGRERVVDLVYNARREAADRGQFFGPADRMDCFDASGDVFTDGDDMGDLAGIRDLASEPC